jgi:hypothetical protein
MSEGVTLPSDSSIDPAPDNAPVATQATHPAEPGIATAPVPIVSASAPPEAPAVLEILLRGLAPDADESARTAARELCAQAPVPSRLPAPTVPMALPPPSPIAMAAHALRQLPPDQLLELLLQRLRAALPTGASVAAPRGIQFQLVPMTPPPGSR